MKIMSVVNWYICEIFRIQKHYKDCVTKLKRTIEKIKMQQINPKSRYCIICPKGLTINIRH